METAVSQPIGPRHHRRKEHHVSNYHATADITDAYEAVSLRARLATLARRAVAVIARLRAAIEQRFAMQRISRMSNHMLADFGFERDWDGTIRPIRDDAR
jgi:hypothetical protein